MTRRISDTCVNYGSCAGECPVGMIPQGDTQYMIDEFSCIDCGTCEAACLIGAIFEANWEELQ